MSSSNLPDDAMHILVVDDDERIRKLISRFLRENGYRITIAKNAKEARIIMESIIFDLIILDVMMPGETGLEFTKYLRGIDCTTPILMLTAKTEIEDRIAGLEVGVDDYLAKPFDPRELLLRISSILRRAMLVPISKNLIVEEVNFGPFTFNISSGELIRDEEHIKITEREREILKILASSAGEAVAREVLTENSPASNERTLDVQINRLRKKIESDPANAIYLQTVRGSGYRLVV